MDQQDTLSDQSDDDNMLSVFEATVNAYMSSIYQTGQQNTVFGRELPQNNPIPPYTRPTNIRVHIFVGGSMSIQIERFMSAMSHFNSAIVTAETKNVLNVKDDRMSEEDFVDWLAACDCHFIIAHPHQGIIFHMNWNATDLERELLRLYDHPGFPTGESLKCPVFLQNKFEYLKHLDSYRNPTLRIPLSQEYFDTEQFAFSLARFIKENDEGIGWVLKLPFVTNKMGFKFVRTVEEVLSGIASHFREYGNSLPYTMLQPRLLNMKEYKIVLTSGAFAHVNKNASHGKAFMKTPEQKMQIISFAEDAVNILKSRCRAAITDGLIRVDIMQTCRGHYVVNEIESLEANYWSNAGLGAIAEESRVHAFLDNYWLDKLHCLFAF